MLHLHYGSDKADKMFSIPTDRIYIQCIRFIIYNMAGKFTLKYFIDILLFLYLPFA